MQRPHYVDKKALWPEVTPNPVIFIPSLPTCLLCNDCYRPCRSPTFFFLIIFVLFFSLLPPGHSEPDWGRALCACMCVCAVCLCVSLLEWQEANE